VSDEKSLKLLDDWTKNAKVRRRKKPCLMMESKWNIIKRKSNTVFIATNLLSA